jgi:hypothetical protein
MVPDPKDPADYRDGSRRSIVGRHAATLLMEGVAQAVGAWGSCNSAGQGAAKQLADDCRAGCHVLFVGPDPKGEARSGKGS